MEMLFFLLCFNTMLRLFSESRLWECRVFSFKNARASQMSRVFPFTFHLFLLLEALRGFEILREALGGFGTPCEVLEALDGFVMFWEALALEGFGKPLQSLGRLWEALA